MCGLCGIVLRSNSGSVSQQQITTMNDQMLHRGPDAHGVFLHNNIALGHRRLKIIDLAGGVQPMFSKDKDVVVVFNGEIYNFKEIRARLETKGYEFASNSDTEVIIHAYREFGEDCSEHFRGMFAIAIYDKKLDKLFLIRDRLGIKPVYYYLDDDRLLFASEIKPILSMLDAKPTVKISALDFYISVGYVPGSDTLFSEINKLEPGHTLTLVDNRVSIKQYWNLENTPTKNIEFESALLEFERIATESIKLRLQSDVPLGAFLSGGLDSSVIVALMDKLTDEPVNTFSVGYKDEPESNELEYAKIVAEHFKTNHHEYILEPLDFFNSLDLLLEHTEEPIVESAAVALYQISKLAKDHVTVILSGEGGDEILAGYPLHQIMPKIDRLHSIVRWIPSPLRTLVSRMLSHHEKASKYWDWINLPLPQRYQSISNDVTLSIKKNLYQSPELLKAHVENSAYFAKAFNTMSNGTNLRKMTYADIKTWLPDDLLVKADKMTMAASLELRVPFLDHKLLEYSTALPDEYRLNQNQGKYLLKKFAEKLLPDEIIYRKKKGFPVPIASWFRDKLYDKTREILLDERSLARGYFQANYIENMLTRHKSGKEDLSRRIFTLLNIELWHRKYIDS